MKQLYFIKQGRLFLHLGITKKELRNELAWHRQQAFGYQTKNVLYKYFRELGLERFDKEIKIKAVECEPAEFSEFYQNWLESAEYEQMQATLQPPKAYEQHFQAAPQRTRRAPAAATKQYDRQQICELYYERKQPLDTIKETIGIKSVGHLRNILKKAPYCQQYREQRGIDSVFLE